MIDWTIESLIWWTSGWLGLLVYWVPVAFCLFGYLIKSWGDYRRDVLASEKQHYTPRLRVGTIIGRAIISVIPIANLFAGIFDVAPRLFGEFIQKIEKVFSIPLVKPRN